MLDHKLYKLNIKPTSKPILEIALNVKQTKTLKMFDFK